ncbi:hypothetical protein HD554DRAFT_2083658 [Boletus coccyginus]|nr:hypothetical protein HD554DRAFT_2083658 [Boletus coccyginus]
MPAPTAAERTPWDTPCPLGFVSNVRNDPPSLHQVSCDITPICLWVVDGSMCNRSFFLGDNLKHSISRHLRNIHGLHPASGKSSVGCQWIGCDKTMKRESIVRHIVAVHLRVATKCGACGTFFARPDSLQRHMKNSGGACKRKD